MCQILSTFVKFRQVNITKASPALSLTTSAKRAIVRSARLKGGLK